MFLLIFNIINLKVLPPPGNQSNNIGVKRFSVNRVTYFCRINDNDL
jgi:hypothetical protein